MSTVQCAMRADITILGVLCASPQHNINACSFNEWIGSIHVYAEILQREKYLQEWQTVLCSIQPNERRREPLHPWYKDRSKIRFKNFSPNWVLVYRRNLSVHGASTLQVYNIGNGNTQKYTECVFWNPVLTISDHHVWSPNCLNWSFHSLEFWRPWLVITMIQRWKIKKIEWSWLGG